MNPELKFLSQILRKKALEKNDDSIQVDYRATEKTSLDWYHIGVAM